MRGRVQLPDRGSAEVQADYSDHPEGLGASIYLLFDSHRDLKMNRVLNSCGKMIFTV